MKPAPYRNDPFELMTSQPDVPVLSVEHLTIAYQIERARLDVVRDVSLRIEAGQTYGLVGESGSGKTTLALAIMRYLASNGEVRSGRILLDGEDLLAKTIAGMRQIWGVKLSMVPQDPGASLNPALKIGDQLAEIGEFHDRLTRRQAWNRGVERLREVRIGDAEQVANRYPHQLSGGMQQRVLIAMALSAQPRLLILDEPTTNLDVTTEAVVLDLFEDLIKKYHAATLYVTHNLGVVAQVCDRAAVLYAGEVMEDASTIDLFKRPLHPYTIELLSCVPRLGNSQRGVKLRTVKGRLPSLRGLPKGCIFADRCPLAIDRCFAEKPESLEVAPGRVVKCHRWEEIATGAIGRDRIEQNEQRGGDETKEPETLLKVEAVSKTFSVGSTFLNPLTVTAVDQVSLQVGRAQTIGLVGESGSGKTTLARCIIGLIERTRGDISLSEVVLAPRIQDRPAELLKRLQMVFQNPEESLNPYQTVGEALRRPLLVLAKIPSREVDARVRDLLRAVHLDANYADRFPAELSGGEKQRIAIARAFATDPELVVCDESVSALDVSVQASILNLLSELKLAQDTSYIFISHDLAVVSYLADIVAVMYLGQLVEIGPRDQLFSPPLHPYTEALISAVPVPDPTSRRERIRLETDIPSPIHLPSGCRFHTRCPRKIGPICEDQEPPWVDAGDNHRIRCHYSVAELKAMQHTSPEPRS